MSALDRWRKGKARPYGSVLAPSKDELPVPAGKGPKLVKSIFITRWGQTSGRSTTSNLRKTNRLVGERLVLVAVAVVLRVVKEWRSKGEMSGGRRPSGQFV